MCLVHLISSLGSIQTEEIAKAVTSKHRLSLVRSFKPLTHWFQVQAAVDPSGLAYTRSWMSSVHVLPNQIQKKSASLQGQVENLVNYEWLVGFSLTFLSVSGHLYLFLPKAEILQCKMFLSEFTETECSCFFPFLLSNISPISPHTLLHALFREDVEQNPVTQTVSKKHLCLSSSIRGKAHPQ